MELGHHHHHHHHGHQFYQQFSHPLRQSSRVGVSTLDELCKTTKFSRKEIQIMYRSFKQECPTGYVEEDTFRVIFAQFFPCGNSSLYAHYVFKTFDQNKSGSITFKDFVQCLSLMSRGSVQEKLQWAFRLYDINGDGRVTKKELMDIVCSVYALNGTHRKPLGSYSTSTSCSSNYEERSLRDHVDKIFQKLDINKDGVVTIDEFMEICSKDDTITTSLTLFDTVL